MHVRSDLRNMLRKCCLAFRILELIASVICLILAILIIHHNDPKTPFVPLALKLGLLSASVMFTIITLYDLIYYVRRQPVYTHTNWWPYATLGTVVFFVLVGLIIFAQNISGKTLLTLLSKELTYGITSLIFSAVTGLIFLFDLLHIILRFLNDLKRPASPKEDTSQASDTSRTARRFMPRASNRMIQKAPIKEKYPPSIYVHEMHNKSTSYQNVPVMKKSSAVIPRVIQYREPQGTYRSPQVVQSPTRTEEKCTQSSNTSVCNCQMRDGVCHQCKWVKYLVKAQQREESRKERRRSNVSQIKYTSDDSQSTSSLSSLGNENISDGPEQKLTVHALTQDASSQCRQNRSFTKVETKQSIHNLQNTTFVQAYVEEQRISPNQSIRQASRQNPIRDANKLTYSKAASVIVASEPSTGKDDKFTQADRTSDNIQSIDKQTSTSRYKLIKSRPRRKSSQEEVAIQVINYQEQGLQKISEESIQPGSKSNVNNASAVPKIHIPDTKDSENTDRTPSDISPSVPSPPTPSKQTQFDNDTLCSCTRKSPAEDVICVHCLRQWRKYQSSKSSGNAAIPPKLNEKIDELDRQAILKENESNARAEQIKQASALFQYISPKSTSNTSPTSSHLYSPTTSQPTKPSSHKPAARRSIRTSSRSEPPKVTCICEDNTGEVCKMHNSSKYISLPTSASVLHGGTKQTNFAIKTERKDRYKTSP